MSQPYIGEIKMFAGNFAPRSYALCNGQILSISQNTALFSILGTTYGGNGTSTFALPNLQGSAPMGKGNGAGLTPRFLGEVSGESSVTLISSQMPVHNHLMQGNEATADLPDPSNATFGMVGGRGRPGTFYAVPSPFTAIPMAPQSLGLTGGSQPHNNMQPYAAVTFIIALQGVFPPRN